MSETPLAKVLESLSPGVRPVREGFMARCPAHDDSNPSLSVKEGDDGRVLLKCFAGCAVRSIVEAAGVTMTDLFPAPPGGHRRNGHRNGQERRCWEIRDADGRLITVHERKDAPGGRKNFWWRQPNGKLGLDGTPPRDLPLYGAEKTRSWAADAPIVIVEGEKAADALRAVYEPVLATVTGAQGTPGPETLEILRGRCVVLWPDADEPGHAHMRSLAAALRGITSEVRVYRWPDPPKDVKGPDAADHPAVISGEPGAVAELLVKLRDAPTWVPEPAYLGTSGEEHVGLEGRVRLAELIKGGIKPTPQLVGGLLYEGRIASVAGEPGTGKTLLALYLALEATRRGRAVLYLDAENGPRLMAERLRDLGADLGTLDERFAYYQAHLTLDPADTARLAATVAEVRPGLVILDSFADFIAAAGLEENSNTDCTRWVARIVQPLREAGIAVLILDHVPKGAKGPRGAGAKVAKVDVQWNLEVAQQFDREKTGEIILKLAKDREGYLPKTFTFSVGGGVFAPSSGTIEEPGTDGLTDRQRKVLDFLEGRGSEGATWRDLEAEIGSKSTLSRALKELAQRNLFDKKGSRYYLQETEPKSVASKPDQLGSSGFRAGSTEPTEPGNTGEVPQVPPPFRGGTVEPDASNPDEEKVSESVERFLAEPPNWWSVQAQECVRQGSPERLVNALASATAFEVYGTATRWLEVLLKVRERLEGVAAM